MERYAIGLDFGTESGRAVLVNVTDGHQVATAVHAYRHGVIDQELPSTGATLPHDFALQHPGDWLEVLGVTIPAVLEEAGVEPEQVIGIGTDFTACTMLPIDSVGQPLCLNEAWREEPHAWPKLWKHHAAQPEANRLNELAQQRGERWLQRYGGKVSSEWLIPKIWETLIHAPAVYQAADRFIEASDWIVLQLTGEECRNACAAGYKGLWHKQQGYPSGGFLASLDARLGSLVDDRLSRQVYPLGGRAGGLTEAMAEMTGLRPRTAVALGIIDAHASVPAATVVEPGRMVIIMGTSNCHMVLDARERLVPGISGVVEDGIVPGYFAYEAGQACVGDHFAWFVRNCCPQAYWEHAQERGIDIYRLLEEKAADQRPGEHGLLALDWWNGNRSVLVDADLTGLLLGVTLTTRPEEIYRALIEATAYGTRMIIDTFQEHGVAVDEIVACGGLAERNRLLMQIYADVTGREIRVAAAPQASALGSAMFGAVAAGSQEGGYDSIVQAAKQMARLKEASFRPDAQHRAVYDQLYAEYTRLHDYFGRGENDVMKRLKRLKTGS